MPSPHGDPPPVAHAAQSINGDDAANTKPPTPRQSGRSSGPPLVIKTACIAASAVTAGSIFCFPLFGPSLTRDLGLNLTRTNTIWVGAVLGEYLSAAPWGALADSAGPRFLSISAAILFSSGYFLMAGLDSHAVRAATAARMGKEAPSDGIGSSSDANFMLMTLYFILVGTGVAASVFATLTTSTRTFPHHPTLAVALPLTLLSMSSLLLTQLASLPYFIDERTGDLDAARFLAFLGALLAVVNGVGAWGMGNERGADAPEPDEGGEEEGEGQGPSREADERTPLLPSGEGGGGGGAGEGAAAASAGSALPYVARDGSLGAFLASPAAWALSLLMFASVGGAEMVMSSVGSIVVSLRGATAGRPRSEAAVRAAASALARMRGEAAVASMLAGPELGKETLRIRSQQVQLLSVANTVSRLAAGLLTDALSPGRPPSRSSASVPAGTPWTVRGWAWVRRRRLSRLTVVLGAMAGLCVAFVYAATALTSTEGLWPLSVLSGCGYGLVFTLIPSIILQAYGPHHLGRDYGLVTYAAAAGSFFFSILFAAVSDAVAARRTGAAPATGALGAAEAATSWGQAAAAAAPVPGVCLEGAACFRASFVAAAAAAVVGAAAVVPLWRSWRHRL